MLFPYTKTSFAVASPPYRVNEHPSSFRGIAFGGMQSSSNQLLENLEDIKVINVASNKARWNAMTSQLRAAGILRYTRVDAVDGSKMDNKTLRGLVTTETYVRIMGQKPRSSHAEISTKGQVACALSHKKCWHDLVFAKPSVESRNSSYVTIFEDDCSVGPDTVYQVHEALKSLPQDADIILYGTIGIPTISGHAAKPWVRVTKFFGLQGNSLCFTLIVTQ